MAQPSIRFYSRWLRYTNCQERPRNHAQCSKTMQTLYTVVVGMSIHSLVPSTAIQNYIAMEMLTWYHNCPTRCGRKEHGREKSVWVIILQWKGKNGSSENFTKKASEYQWWRSFTTEKRRLQGGKERRWGGVGRGRWNSGWGIRKRNRWMDGEWDGRKDKKEGKQETQMKGWQDMEEVHECD